MILKVYHETDHGVIYCGDSLSDTYPNANANLVLTDPPYGTTACHWDGQIEYDTFWDILYRNSVYAAPHVMTASEPFAAKIICSNLNCFKHEWIWDKVSGANFMNLKNQPLKTHEKVLVFCKTPRYTFNPQRVFRTEKSLKRDPIGCARIRKERGGTVEHYGLTRESEYTFSSDGRKHPISIIKASKYERGRYKFKHPTKKPVNLFKYFVMTFSNPCETVFDPFGGSGTTAIASILEGRRYFLIEKEEKYCEIAARRIEDVLEQIEIFREVM